MIEFSKREMAGYLSMKMKRKDLEEVDDEFSDFSLSSPARKIRRLDADFSPIMQKEEFGLPQIIEKPSQEQQFTNSMEQITAPIITEELQSLPLNEERALVLYKPVNAPLFQSPSSSNFSISVNSEWIPGFKNQFLWSGQSNPVRTMEKDDYHLGNDDSLAVVPWVPSQFNLTSEEQVTVTEVAEPMEAEEGGVSSMETEEENNIDFRESGGRGEGEGLQQWQQQHCVIPQLPQITSTPITWSG